MTYDEWAAQQHQYLQSAGGYGPAPAPPPDQAPPPDPGLTYDPNTDSFVQQTAPDPTAPPPPPPSSTWGGMASAPPIQAAPAPPPPSGPTLGPMGGNSAGPVMGTDAGQAPLPPPPPQQPQAPDQSGYGANQDVNAALDQGAATGKAVQSVKADEQKAAIQQATPLVPSMSAEQQIGAFGPFGRALQMASEQGTSALAPLNPVGNVVADNIGGIAGKAKQVADNSLLAQTPGGELDPAAGIHQAIQQHTEDQGPHSLVQSEQQRQAAVDTQARQAEADARKILLAQHNKSLGFMMSASMAPGGEGLQSFLGHPETLPQQVGNAVGGAANWVVSHADLPRQSNIIHITQQTLDDINGTSSGEAKLPGWDTLQGGIVLRPYTDWMRANPDRALGDATNGYGLDPSTGKPFTGPRAVWEDFIADKPAWQRILYDAGADPLSYLPPADKAVEGVGVAGRLGEKAGLPVAGGIAAGAEKLRPWVEHPLQMIGAKLPDSVYPADVRAARAERQVVADTEKALNSPRLDTQPQAAQAAPNQSPVQPGPRPTNGRARGIPSNYYPADLTGTVSPRPPTQVMVDPDTNEWVVFYGNVETDRFPAPAAPPTQPMPPPPNIPSPNGAAPAPAPAPVPTNGHAPATNLPPVTITPNGAAPLSPDAERLAQHATQAIEQVPLEPSVVGVPEPAAIPLPAPQETRLAPEPAAVPPVVEQAAPQEPDVLGVEAPAPEPTANQQRLTQAQADLAQMAQTGEVPPSVNQTQVQQTFRARANAPQPVRTDAGLDFGHGVTVSPRQDGRFQVAVDGVPQGQAQGYPTEGSAGGFAGAIAQHRDAQATLDRLKTIPAADWNSDAARADRNRLYRNGQLTKDYKPGTPAYANQVDLNASRLQGAQGDQIKAGLQHDLQMRPTPDTRQRPLDPRVYNDIMDRAGKPTEKIDPHTFYVGPDDNRHPLIAGAPVRNVDWPDGEIGTLEKSTSDGLGVVVTRRGQQEVVPLDHLDAHVIPTDHDASGQAVGFLPKKPAFIENAVNAVQQAHPNPLKQARLAPDLTTPTVRKAWADHLGGAELEQSLERKINIGTFTNPNHVAIGDLAFRDQDQLLGWKSLRQSGITHVDQAADPVLFADLFGKGIIDANGDLNEGAINKTLVRLGLLDKNGDVTDLGRGLRAQTADQVKDELVKSSDPFLNHLIAKAVGVDFSVSEGVRDAATRAVKDGRTGVGQALDGYMNFRRAVALTNLASGPRYGLMQAIGNAVTLAIAKPTALLDYVAPIEWKKMWQGAHDIRVTSEAEHILRDAGLAQSPLLREIGPMGKNPIAKATWLGPLQKPAQAIFANDVYRRFGNIFDNTIRTALFKTKWDEQYPRILGSLPDRVGDEFARLNSQLPRGALPFPNWQDELKQAVHDIDTVGKKALSADELRRNLLTFYDDKLAANPALAGRLPGRGVWSNFADHLAETWDTALEGVKSAAETEVRRVAFDFDPTKADQLISRLFMFHFWQSRAGGLYAVEALKNPKYVATFVRTMNALENQAKAENAPPFLQWFYKYSQTPDGLGMWFNPTNLVQVWSTGALMNLQSGDDPTANKDMTGYGHFINGPWGSMLFMNPVVKGLGQLFGAEGPDAKTVDLAGDSQAIQRAESLLNAFNQQHPFFTDGQGNAQLITIPDSRAAVNFFLNQAHQRNAMLGLNQQDPNASDKLSFKNFIWDEVKQANPNATPNELQAKATEAEADPGSPAYKAALARKTEADTAGPGAGHGVLGDWFGRAARYGLGNAMFTTTDPAMDARMARTKDAHATPEDKAANNFVFSSGTKEDQTNVAENQYKYPGTKQQQIDQRIYYSILNGNASVADENGNPLTREQLQAMTPDQRQIVADAWLVRHPKSAASIQAIQDAKTQMIRSNPDVAGWQGMQDLAGYKTNGMTKDDLVKVDEWIAATRQRNPGFDSYMAGFEQKSPVGTDDYRKAAFYMDGYKALTGQPRGYNSVGVANPHPDVPGLDANQTLAEYEYGVLDAKDKASADKIKPVNDALGALGAVKAKMDADDPSGGLWASYRDYVVQQSALPYEQQDKRIPGAYYTYVKGAYQKSDGTAGNYPPFYGVDYMRWAAAQGDGQDLSVENYWKATTASRSLYAAQHAQTETAFDPASLVGKSSNNSPTGRLADSPTPVGQAMTTADLNLRDGPGGAILGVGPSGAVVDVLKVDGDWVQVRFSDGRTGWMAGAYLKKQ